MALPPHNPDFVPTGPNNKANEYYKRINTVRLARGDYNRSEFFGTVGGVPGVEVPAVLQQADTYWPTDDPSTMNNVADGGQITTIDPLVGTVQMTPNDVATWVAAEGAVRRSFIGSLMLPGAAVWSGVTRVVIMLAIRWEDTDASNDRACVSSSPASWYSGIADSIGTAVHYGSTALVPTVRFDGNLIANNQRDAVFAGIADGNYHIVETDVTIATDFATENGFIFGSYRNTDGFSRDTTYLGDIAVLRNPSAQDVLDARNYLMAKRGIVQARNLNLSFFGSAVGAPRIPFPPAAFIVENATPPLVFYPGDGNGPIVVNDINTINNYYYEANGVYTARIETLDATEVSETTVNVDWISEPPTELSVEPVPTSSPDLWGVLIEGGPGPFTVDWGDGTIIDGEDGFAQHRYAVSGSYTITATNPFGISGQTSVVVDIPAPPADYVLNASMTVGTQLTRKGFSSGAFGALTPRDWEIYRIDDLFIDKISDTNIEVRVKMFSSLPIYDTKQIKITFDGQTPVTAEWNGTIYTSTYSGVDTPEVAALVDWLTTQVGNTVPVTLEGFVVLGPFTASSGQKYFFYNPTRSTDFTAIQVGFNIDADPAPDLFVSLRQLIDSGLLTAAVIGDITTKAQEIYG